MEGLKVDTMQILSSSAKVSRCVGVVGGLDKYSFLCPNGSLFSQQYFVCDFSFNVDCSRAETLYSLNDDLAREREANIGAVSQETGGLGGSLDGGLGNSFQGRNNGGSSNGGFSSGNNNGGFNPNNNNNNNGGGRPITGISTGYGAPGK